MMNNLKPLERKKTIELQTKSNPMNKSSCKPKVQEKKEQYVETNTPCTRLQSTLKNPDHFRSETKVDDFHWEQTLHQMTDTPNKEMHIANRFYSQTRCLDFSQKFENINNSVPRDRYRESYHDTCDLNNDQSQNMHDQEESQFHQHVPVRNDQQIYVLVIATQNVANQYADQQIMPMVQEVQPLPVPYNVQEVLNEYQRNEYGEWKKIQNQSNQSFINEPRVEDISLEIETQEILQENANNEQSFTENEIISETQLEKITKRDLKDNPEKTKRHIENNKKKLKYQQQIQKVNKQCNCKQSQCLKAYCDCFSSGNLCGKDCNCQGCCNTKDHPELILKATTNLMSRDLHAFDSRIIQGENKKKYHTKGCACKKSECRKKYCECFSAGIDCSNICKCQGCQNCTTTDQVDKIIKKKKLD